MHHFGNPSSKAGCTQGCHLDKHLCFSPWNGRGVWDDERTSLTHLLDDLCQHLIIPQGEGLRKERTRERTPLHTLDSPAGWIIPAGRAEAWAERQRKVALLLLWAHCRGREPAVLRQARKSVCSPWSHWGAQQGWEATGTQICRAPVVWVALRSNQEAEFGHHHCVCLRGFLLC